MITNRLLQVIPMALLLSVTMYAQEYKTIADINHNCALAGLVVNTDAEDAVDGILETMGLFKNFIVQECPNVNQVEAKNILKPDGSIKRILIHDDGFFAGLKKDGNQNWMATGILAHQMAHLLKEHDLNNLQGLQKREIEAAELAGFVLAKLGATMEEAKAMIEAPYFPKKAMALVSKDDHTDAVTSGWRRGDGKIITTTTISESDKNGVIVINSSMDRALPNPNTMAIENNKTFAQKVLQRYLGEIGGEDPIKKMRSMRIKTTISSKIFNSGFALPEFVQNKTIEYLSPNVSHAKIVNTKTNDLTFALELNGDMYTKTNENDSWEFKGAEEFDNQVISFIPEYALVLNNEEVRYLGETVKEGKNCFVIQLPDKNVRNETERAVRSLHQETRYFYSEETGLLLCKETSSHRTIDYNNTNEDLQDLDRTEVETTVYSDYTEVDGIRLPLKQSISKVFGEGGEISSLQQVNVTEIQINPVIDLKKFEIEK